MASDIVLERNDERDLVLAWSGRWSLTHRILAVNLLVLALIGLAIVSLDSYRRQLQAERASQMLSEARLAARSLEATPRPQRAQLAADFGVLTHSRVRVFDAHGALVIDGWSNGNPTYQLRDPLDQGWRKDAARTLDRGFNWVVGHEQNDDFFEPPVDNAAAWREIGESRASRGGIAAERIAPDLTPLFSAAVPMARGDTLLVTTNDRDFTRTVRAQRSQLALAILVVALLSVMLSLFLARTIARPLRRIALAAYRVRLGRAREVNIPRLPSRRDEIGMLARAVSDMSQSLRHQIDNVESFAADVTHELKNPLASLRSAVDGLDRIEDPALRRQLLGVVRQDVLRLDRLISDVGEAARTDAELARARFAPVDLGEIVGQLVSAWETRRETGDVRLAFARPRKGSAIALAEPHRLARAIDNLIDNAISFSPPGGLVEIAVARVGSNVRIRIEDEGPGVPEAQREAIFNRFHSIRPDAETFGRHSGLGLAIARAIVEGHDGEIDVTDRDDAPSGARFTIQLPASEDLV